jgi:cobalamin biosynthesis protein CbiG
VALREAVIAAGLGFRAGCTHAQLDAALRASLREHARALHDVSCLAVADFKAEDEQLLALARALGKPLHVCALAALRANVLPTLTQSSEITRRYGVGSLSEACALSAAAARGSSARLLGPRSLAGSVTCALAISLDQP